MTAPAITPLPSLRQRLPMTRVCGCCKRPVIMAPPRRATWLSMRRADGSSHSSMPTICGCPRSFRNRCGGGGPRTGMSLSLMTTGTSHRMAARWAGWSGAGARVSEYARPAYAARYRMPDGGYRQRANFSDFAFPQSLPITRKIFACGRGPDPPGHIGHRLPRDLARYRLLPRSRSANKLEGARNAWCVSANSRDFPWRRLPSGGSNLRGTLFGSIATRARSDAQIHIDGARPPSRCGLLQIAEREIWWARRDLNPQPGIMSPYCSHFA